MSTSYLRITAPITQYSAQKILQIIDAKYREGIDEMRILISTPGGSVSRGVAIYNFLKGIPMRITTHNFGTVDSIGLIIYCAGEERLSVPHARFMLHPVGFDVHQSTRVDENWLIERKASLNIDQLNIARIFAAATSSDQNSVLKLIRERKTFMPEEAKSNSLVTRIDEILLPKNADFHTVHESEANPPQQVPIQHPLQMTQAMPIVDSTSSIYAYEGNVQVH